MKLICKIFVPLFIGFIFSCTSNFKKIEGKYASTTECYYLIMSIANGCDDCNKKVFNFIETRKKEIQRNPNFDVIFVDVTADKHQKRNFDFNLIKTFKVDATGSFRKNKIIDFYPVFIKVKGDDVIEEHKVSTETISWMLPFIEARL